LPSDGIEKGTGGGKAPPVRVRAGMGEELRIDLPESRRGKGAVVDRLVSFLKASYIYPANNRRVVDAADDLIDEVDRTAKSDRGVVVQVLGEGIRVDGEEVELSTGLTGWLKDAFVNARLAGIQLKRGVSRETLHGFADRLRRSRALALGLASSLGLATAASLAALWTHAPLAVPDLPAPADVQVPALRALPELLKRTALAAWPRSDVARLSGSRWLSFLEKAYCLRCGRF